MKIEGHINQYKYQQMLLDSGVFTDMNGLSGPSGWLFVGGAAPAAAHSTQAFLSLNCRGLPKDLTWPPHSSDLNPIEHGRGILKGTINTDGRQDADTLYEQAQIIRRDIEVNLRSTGIGTS
jgi:hypothetical protein